MDAKPFIHNRLLHKTGQVTSYRDGDDGYYERGWWNNLLNADNKTRFIKFLSGSDYLVLDRATGLIWPWDLSGDGGNSGGMLNWDESIDWANALDFGGKTDWRLPNTVELESIMDLGRVNPCLPAGLFDNTISDQYWTSTTYNGDTLNAWYSDFIIGGTYHSAKTTDYNVVAVRNQ